MATNKQREASRRQLEQQLKDRQERETRRRRATLIGSVVGTLALIVVVVVIIAVATSGGGGKGKGKPQAGGNQSKPSTTATSPSPSPTTVSSAPVKLDPPKACAAPGKGASATFDGVTVGEATNLAHEPKVASKSSAVPTALECADLVVGTGAKATPTSQVSVQYTGVLYKDGTEFDSSWANGGKPVSFALTGVVPGFTQGIGGIGKVAPMRVGGRRIMILPASLGYGASGSGSIPPNATLVFVVDLTKATAS